MCYHEQLVYGNPLEYPFQLCCALTGSITQIHSSPSGIFLLAGHLADLICNLPMLEKSKLYVDEGVTTGHGGGGDPENS